MEGWRELRRSCHLLFIAPSAFELAAEFAGRPTLNLRASDALHLAVARLHGCALVTLDERMARAAPKLGVAMVTV